MLALASFTACLHYDDVVERLQLYNKLQHLAEIYPGMCSPLSLLMDKFLIQLYF